MKAVIKRSALVVGLSLMGVMASQAATISYNVAFPTGFPPTTFETDSGAHALLLPLFNPSLGTLTKITLTQEAGVAGSIQAENMSGTAKAGVGMNLQATVTLSAPGSLSVISVPLIALTHDFAGFDGTLNFLGPSGFTQTIPDGAISDTDSLSSTNAGVLALYTGVGNFSFTVNAVGQSGLVAGSGNFAAIFLSNFGSRATVTYEYNLPPSGVPEPATYFMMGSGLLGLVFLARRRNRS